LWEAACCKGKRLFFCLAFIGLHSKLSHVFNSDVAPFGVGKTLIILYVVNGKMEDVRVYSKYTEIKSAAIRGRIPILNSEN